VTTSPAQPSDDPPSKPKFLSPFDEAGVPPPDSMFVEDKPPAPLIVPAPSIKTPDIKLGDDIEVKLNNQRHNLASHLLWGLLVISAGLIVAVILVPSDRQADLREMATLIFPTLVTLAGTSFAWFYATRNRDR